MAYPSTVSTFAGGVGASAAPARPIASRLPYVSAAAVFFAVYLTWRPLADTMFTLSDALFVLAAGSLALQGRLQLQPFGALTPIWTGALALVLAGLLIGSVDDPDPLRWVIVAAQYCFAWLLLPFVLIGHGRERALVLAMALLFGVVAMEAFGAFIYFKYIGSFWDARELLGIDFLTGARRLGAFTADANWNGAAISMALPFAYYLMLKRQLPLLVGIPMVAVLLVGLALTASFTAFTSMCVAAVLFTLVGRLKIDLKVAVIAIVVAGAGYELSTSLPPAFQARVMTALERGDISEAGTFVGRTALVTEAWGMTGDHLLTGVGADQYRVISVHKAPVHNMYLLLWVEGGFIAMLGWIAMMGVLVGQGLAFVRSDRLGAALVLSVVSTLLIFTLASPHMYARLWSVPVLLAIALARAAPLASRPVGE